MVDPKDVLDTFKSFFDSLTYEERVAYLKKMGFKFSDDEEIEEDVETEVEEIEYSERDMHRTGIDPELVIENFKEFFNKMTYEEREAYLKRMGFSFGDECGSSDEDLEV